MAVPARFMELTEREMFPRSADMVEPVVSEGVETVIPPTPDVLTAPLRVAEVPAETFRAEALIV